MSDVVTRARDTLTEEVVEQFTAVLVRVEPIVNVGLESRVDVSVVEFAVEDQEDGVCEQRRSEWQRYFVAWITDHRSQEAQ
jgi:hypothetical protein